MEEFVVGKILQVFDHAIHFTLVNSTGRQEPESDILSLDLITRIVVGSPYLKTLEKIGDQVFSEHPERTRISDRETDSIFEFLEEARSQGAICTVFLKSGDRLFLRPLEGGRDYVFSNSFVYESAQSGGIILLSFDDIDCVRVDSPEDLALNKRVLEASRAVVSLGEAEVTEPQA